MLGISPSQSQGGLGYLEFSQHGEVEGAQWGVPHSPLGETGEAILEEG